MHIIIISACEKRAIKKTRAALDSYAVRIGETSWATPITEEGMREMRAVLKRGATRQTAVACYRNDGRRRMKLLWIVGSKRPFGPDGHFPCGYMQVKKFKELLPTWVRLAALLARAGGLAHDMGKAMAHFQEKLARSLSNAFQREVDPVRHEWVSMRLIQELRKGQDVKQSWGNLTNQRYLQELSLKQGIGAVYDVLDFLVVSHHRLFGPLNEPGIPSRERHCLREGRAEISPAGDLPMRWQETYAATLERIKKTAGEQAPGYWRALAVWARAALIFADHLVSAREEDNYGQVDNGLYANTAKIDKGKKRGYNQPLLWHLEHVSQVAAKTVYRLATLRLPSLSEEAVERILELSDNKGPFAWQNRAANVLQGIRQTSEAPVLVFNIASTGAGKTRMNAKCACILGQAGRIRFAVALNQRTLTLQTGDALSLQLGIGKDEMATVVGDKIATILHETGRTDIDGNEIETEFESDGFFGEEEFEQVLPEWLAHLSVRKPFLARILGAPVLASTIDFIISAGELNRQGNHVSALLRLLDSDLVLDEIDSYDPIAMVAVLRLIQMVGLSGRNLVCSSATLAFPVAQAVHEAYQSGISMRAQLFGKVPEFAVAVIDDLVNPTVVANENFTVEYQEHISQMLLEMGKKIYRRPVLQMVAGRDESSWLEAVAEAVNMMHNRNAWGVGEAEKTISFGLVRVANIKTAIRVARFLADRLPQARVACYHSQDFVVQRFIKEQRLDFLLNRKKGNNNINADPEIVDIVARSPFTSIPFIVVATPVEEIGRDHDFDWAVIEPSSSQSIVQTAGRVNRHRRMTITEPNVAILQFNARWARGQDICFCRPGLESISHRYDSHDLAELLCWDYLKNGLDARLRFVGHRFGQLDDESIRTTLKDPMKGLCDLSQANVVWLTEGFYRKYPLRSGEPKQTWRLGKDDDGDDCFELLELINYEQRFISKHGWVNDEERAPNDWLCFNTDELRERCHEYGIREQDGLRFDMVRHSSNDHDNQSRMRVVFDRSFGFYLLS